MVMLAMQSMIALQSLIATTNFGMPVRVEFDRFTHRFGQWGVDHVSAPIQLFLAAGSGETVAFVHRSAELLMLHRRHVAATVAELPSPVLARTMAS